MALVLGGLAFTDYATPEVVQYGGRQSMAVHKLLGGDRVIDAMGDDPHDVTWSGRFQGSSASALARSLKGMQQAGAQLPLIFGSNVYLVIISDLQLDYQRSYQILYRVTCTVVSTVGGAIASVTSTLDTLVSGDLASVAARVSKFTAAVL